MGIKIKDNMSQKILVTGGLGYVGGRVSRFLSGKKDIELIITTRKKRAVFPEWIKKRNILEVDMSLNSDLYKACEEIDCIVHFAGMNEIECARDPEKALEVNAGNTYRLLQAAIKQKVKRFIYFSTAHVYGAPLQGKITEKTIPRPVHPYAITHRVAEDFVLSAHDEGKIIGIILRLSNGFGSPETPDINRWSLLVNDLCHQIVCKGKIILKSSGLQKRDFITLFNVCRALDHFLTIDKDLIQNGLFNLGGSCSLQIIEMANLIALRAEKQFGFKPLISKPMTKEEILENLEYNIDKITQTGFDLIDNFKQEIDDTLLFCKKHFS
jgi:UDP-glucose 4-epimerase